MDKSLQSKDKEWLDNKTTNKTYIYIHTHTYCLQETHFRAKDTQRLKVKRYFMQMETNKQKA